MAKLILLSVILVSVALPITLSTRGSPRKQLKNLRIAIVLFVAFWSYMCLAWYPALVPID